MYTLISTFTCENYRDQCGQLPTVKLSPNLYCHSSKRCYSSPSRISLITIAGVQLLVGLYPAPAQSRASHQGCNDVNFHLLALHIGVIGVLSPCVPFLSIIFFAAFNTCLPLFWTKRISAAARNFNPLYKLRVFPSLTRMLTQLKRITPWGIFSLPIETTEVHGTIWKVNRLDFYKLPPKSACVIWEQRRQLSHYSLNLTYILYYKF